MESSVSDEDMDFIKRQPIIRVDSELDDSRPVTPPMDENIKLNKCLGLVLSPQSPYPPYRRIRSLKLAGSPAMMKPPCFGPQVTSTPMPSSPFGLDISRRNYSMCDLPSRIPSYIRSRHNLSLGSSPSACLNPFIVKPNEISSDVKGRSRKKRLSGSKSSKLELEDTTPESGESSEDHLEVKKARLCDFNFSRYEEEFIELGVIGSGSYGCVFRCLNRLNGVEYAIKKSILPVRNSRLAQNEIFAHGVLEHTNILRNYSNWTENGYVYMQNEYCRGGTLEGAIVGRPMDEKQLRKVLEHIAEGLKFIHYKNLAHMDIKPGNILVSQCPRMFIKSNSEYSEEFCTEEDDLVEDIVYKIGDLGHVTRLDEVVDVEEGDCRYFPRELLNDDYSNLTKVDIFALGMTLYEAAGGGPLPLNGEEWQALRDGKLKTFSNLGQDFNHLLKKMTHPNPEGRPSASEILSLSAHSPIYKTIKQKHELKAAKHRIQVLEQELQNVFRSFKVQLRAQSTEKTNNNNTFKNNNISLGNNKGERLVGKKSKRSQSTSAF